MKRYLLFYGSFYYPGGGMNDLEDESDKLIPLINKVWSKAENEHLSKKALDRLGKWNWAHIFDTQLNKVIWRI